MGILDGIRLVIFDFDGVIMHSEPLHFATFAEVLKEEGIDFTWEEYKATYLAYNDRDCFRHVLEDKGWVSAPTRGAATIGKAERTFDENFIASLVTRKSEKFDATMETELKPVDGTPEFIRRVAKDRRLAIASGALRHEIEMLLEQQGLRELFPVIVGAEDVKHGKPAPDAFLAALDQTNVLVARREATPQHLQPSAFSLKPIAPGECLVIEDSPLGIKGAKEAGMHTLGLTTSYPGARLAEAETVGDSLKDIG
jgi:beta-phosphoglucomutase-like phosphatase (HAD superfamily)